MAIDPAAHRVGPDLLRWECERDGLPCETTDDLQPLADIVGQDRAIQALRLGLAIEREGYHLFVSGLSGTGRNTTIQRLLAEHHPGRPVPGDLLYVHNFRNPDEPRLLRLDAGQGRRFRSDLAAAIEGLKKNVPALFDSRDYERRSRELSESFEQGQKEAVRDFERRVEDERFVLVNPTEEEAGPPDFQPLVDGRPTSLDDLEVRVERREFPGERLTTLRQTREDLASRFDGVMKTIRELARELGERRRRLDQDTLRPAVSSSLKELRERYPTAAVTTFLEEVEAAILAEADLFRPETEEDGETDAEAGGPDLDPFRRFEVNLVVDNAEAKAPPVVLEDSPSHKSLFGTIEPISGRDGIKGADHLGVRAGSLLRANGGYLIMNLVDLMAEPALWPLVKRTLRNKRAEIRVPESNVAYPIALRPEGIEIDLKVVLIGDGWSYQVLHEGDPDFPKIFKVRAEFDSEMPRSEQNILAYAAFVRKIADEERLHPFDRSGVGAVVEQGVRLAGRQDRLTTRFNAIVDLLQEADYHARLDGAAIVTRAHVERAVEQRRYRLGLSQDKLIDQIQNGVLLIDTDGSRVGQVNGLTVIELGDIVIGQPVRITARAGIGRGGILNIEREVALSGSIHSKGVLLLGGFLAGRYGQDKPLTLAATLALEQSYEGIEGDSASSAELYALLSTLADLPLRQDLAVTGSVNQVGEVQAVGDVNTKIEGFFDVCRARGLTGRQGVVIPAANVADLMLRREVAAAAAAGRFHVYAVDHVDRAMEILSGVPAGQRAGRGAFEAGSINARVDARLAEFASTLSRYDGRA